jgi:phosphatidylglycerophosphatase C
MAAGKKIAFFDFDGTVTKKDTLLEFIKYSNGRLRFFSGFLLNSPYLVAYKLKIISNHKAKEKILSHFFKKIPVVDFQKTCDAFCTGLLPQLIRSQAMEEINELKSKGFTIVLVSASPGNWISKWAGTNGLELIATCLKTADGKLTGEIEGKNCYGEEKVRRIMERYDLKEFEEVYAYGDTKGDRPMLLLANHSSYKPFRKKK